MALTSNSKAKSRRPLSKTLMGAARRVKPTLERVARVRVFHAGTIPRGIDLFRDLRNDLDVLNPLTVFDVGANDGGSAASYLANFPAATIYCFEPAPTTYEALAARFRDEPRVRTHRLALSDAPGTGALFVSDSSVLSSLSPHAAATEDGGLDQREVDLDSIDRFAAENQIEQIDFLKIDTEGHDLKVLEGTAGMLGREAVQLVEVEAGMSARNKTHVPFERLNAHMTEMNYLLFGLYEQYSEWTRGEPQLRRANALYACSSLIAKQSARGLDRARA